MPLLPHSISPTTVEYRQPLPSGEVIVRVLLGLPTPRFTAWARMDDGSILPITLFIDEIAAYVDDAKARTRKGPTS